MRVIKYLSFCVSSLIILSLFIALPVSADSIQSENGFIYSVIDDTHCMINKYDGEESEICIPEVLAERTVSSIDSRAFSSNQNITSIVMPDTIKVVGDRAFTNCRNLICVIFSESLDTIEDNAFNGCSSLTTVEFPKCLRNIGSSAFRNCTNLVNIRFNSDISSVGYDSFKSTQWYDNQEDGYIIFENVLYGYKGNMPSNEILNIPDDVTCIAECALRDQINLSEVNFSKNIDNIGWGAFANTGITQLSVPNITTIEAFTFSDCNCLNNVTIPNTVNLIDFEAFARCTSLSDVDFDSNIECKINMCAFDDCPSLIRVRLPKLISDISQTAFGYVNSEPISCEVISVPIEGFIIEGYKDSTAETYANKNGFTFTALDDDPDTITTTTTDVAITTTDITETPTETTITSDVVSTITTIETTLTSTTDITDTTTKTLILIDNTSATAETNSTTTPTTMLTTTGETTLPQTGYSKWYQVTAALAVCITGIGGSMVISSGVLKKKRR